VGRTYIVQLESGEKKNPSLDALKKLAKGTRRGVAGVPAVNSLLRSLARRRAIIKMTSAVTALIEAPAEKARDAIPGAGWNRRDSFDGTRQAGRACVVTTANYI